MRQAVEAAIDKLKRLGCEIVPVSLPHTPYAIPTYYLIATAEASSNLARYDGVRYSHRARGVKTLSEMYRRSRDEGFGAEVKRRIMLGTYALSAGYYDAYYLKAQKVRTLLTRDFEEAFRKVDAIVTPTSPTAAFRLGEKSNDPLAMYLADIYTVTADLAGIPGISVPCGETQEKLPIGLQILGKHFDEATILRVAHAYEQALSEFTPVTSDGCRSSFLRRRRGTGLFPSRRTSLRKLIPSPHAVADHAFAFVSGKFFRRQFDFHPLRGEQIVVGDFAVGQHLLLVLVFDFRMHLASQRFRRFFGRDADGFAAVHVDECRCNFSPVAELQRALAQAASGDYGDGVGGAAVDLDEGDQTLAVFAVRIVDAEFLQAEHGEAHAEDLAGAEMSVGLFGVAEIFVEGFHGKAVSYQLVSCSA